jgi:hypothetical protein
LGLKFVIPREGVERVIAGDHVAVPAVIPREGVESQ